MLEQDFSEVFLLGFKEKSGPEIPEQNMEVVLSPCEHSGRNFVEKQHSHEEVSNDSLQEGDHDEPRLEPTLANMKIIISQMTFSKSSKYPKLICEHVENENKNEMEGPLKN